MPTPQSIDGMGVVVGLDVAGTGVGLSVAEGVNVLCPLGSGVLVGIVVGVCDGPAVAVLVAVSLGLGVLVGGTGVFVGTTGHGLVAINPTFIAPLSGALICITNVLLTRKLGNLI